MRFRLQLCCLVGLLGAHAAPAQVAADHDLVIVVDTSGSMSQDEIGALQDGLVDVLASLGPAVRFNLIQFASATRLLFDAPRPATAANLEPAIDWIGAFERGGGTELWQPVNAALAQLRVPGASAGRRIVLVTDGSAGTDRRLLRRIESELGDARLDTLAVGSKFDSRFMVEAAKIGHGRYVRVDAGGEVAAALAGLVNSGPVSQQRVDARVFNFGAFAERGENAVRLSFALAFMLLAAVVVYRLRVDEV